MSKKQTRTTSTPIAQELLGYELTFIYRDLVKTGIISLLIGAMLGALTFYLQ